MVRQHCYILKTSRNQYQSLQQHNASQEQWIEFNELMGSPLSDFSDANMELFVSFKNLKYDAKWSACRGAKYAIKEFALENYNKIIKVTDKDMPATAATLAGLKKLYPRGTNKSPPIDISECKIIINSYATNRLDEQTWRTYWSMKHHGYKRTSELTPQIMKGFELPRLKNIEWYETTNWIAPKQPTIVYFNYDKTKSRAKGSTLFCIYLCQCGDGVCFVHELKRLYKLKYKAFGPLNKNMPIFQFTNGSVITANKADRQLNKVYKKLNLAKGKKSQHGMRSGGVQHALSKGIPIHAVMPNGDWKSVTSMLPYTKYTKKTATTILRKYY